jgi:hypothetical protein
MVLRHNWQKSKPENGMEAAGCSNLHG